MLATLQALRTIGGSANLHELDERIVEQFKIPEDQQSITMPNDTRPKLNYFLAWSRTYLKRGGALENSARGIWAITEVGEAIGTVVECDLIRRRVHEEERARQRSKKKAAIDRSRAPSSEQPTNVETISADGGPEGVEPPREDMPAEEDWRSKLMAVVLEMSPDGFERLSQRLLRESGFIKVEVRGKTGDGGIDGLGVLRVNLVSFQVYFQCKRWKGSVPSKEIRDFRGALQGRADKGLFITTGTFTSAASDEATRDGAIAIDLIDGERLCDLLKQLSLGVQTQTVLVESVTIDPAFFFQI